MTIPTTIRTVAVAIIAAIALTGAVQAQRLNKDYVSYIKKWDKVAVEQMEKYKIPASITLAQGLLESGAGKSTLARRSNNHFGIKCGSSWRGRSVRHDDDAPDECFRAYRSAKDSYEDHSLFLTGNRRYASLFRLKPTDYRGWAKGLKRAGYATNPSYASLLIQIIEDYELYKYDGGRKARRARRRGMTIIPHDTYIANGLLYVVAREDDTFDAIGREFKVKAKKLAAYNDLWRDYPLMAGDIVYLEEKCKAHPGKATYHIVKDGDSMHSIAQTYGVQLKRLFKMNKLDEDYMPEVGDFIWVK